MFIHEWICAHFILSKHLQLASSCHLWSDFIGVESFNRVFKLGALEYCQAVCLEKEEACETVCDIVVTYASPDWLKVRFMEGTMYYIRSLLIQST